MTLTFIATVTDADGDPHVFNTKLESDLTDLHKIARKELDADIFGKLGHHYDFRMYTEGECLHGEMVEILSDEEEELQGDCGE